MSYSEVFRRAWELVKKFRALWILGFLAACGASTSSSFSGFSNSGFKNDFGNAPIDPGFRSFMQRWFSVDINNQEALIAFILVVIGVLIVIGIVLSFLTFILRTIGRGGLAKGAWDADEGKPEIKFGALWSHGLKKFWQVLLFTILIALVDIGIFLVTILPIILLTLVTLGCGLLLIIPLGIAIGWLTSGWFQLGLVAIAAEDMDAMEAFRYTFDLALKNIWKVLAVNLVFTAISFVMIIVVLLPLIVVVAPILIAIGVGAENYLIPIIITILLGILYTLVMIVIGAIYSGYMGTVWALVYRRLIGKGPMGSTIEPILPLPPRPVDITPTSENVQTALEPDQKEEDMLPPAV